MRSITSRTTGPSKPSSTFAIRLQEETKTEIESLSTPYFYLEYKNAIATATNNGGTENEGKFFKNEGAEYYIVGNENAFKFLPVAVAFDEEELEELLQPSIKLTSGTRNGPNQGVHLVSPIYFLRTKVL